MSRTVRVDDAVLDALGRVADEMGIEQPRPQGWHNAVLRDLLQTRRLAAEARELRRFYSAAELDKRDRAKRHDHDTERMDELDKLGKEKGKWK